MLVVFLRQPQTTYLFLKGGGYALGVFPRLAPVRIALSRHVNFLEDILNVYHCRQKLTKVTDNVHTPHRLSLPIL